MAVSINISITQNSQNIANNTSNVTVRVNASWTGGSHNNVVDASGTPQAKGWLKIDGTSYDFASKFNTGETTTGGCEIFKKTVNVSHNSDGSKTLSCSASYTTGVSSGTVTASASKTLTRIARKSSLSVKSGTLGSATTLTVTRQADSLTHTITYVCGSTSGTICTKSSNTSISWTPPISLASQYPTRTSIPIVYTITTYSGSTSVGSSDTTMGYSVPSSVKPSCSISVTDPTGISDIYGSPVQGLSKFKVVVTPTTSYGAAISSYKSDANGSTYTSASFTTGVLNSSGTLKVTSTVTDKRGRSGSNSVSKTVLEYSDPVISKLLVKRCDENGTANDQGDHVQVSLAGKITSLNGKNTSSYILKYKRSSDGDDAYVAVDLANAANEGTFVGTYTVQSIDGTYIFPAETGSSYNVVFEARDSHNPSSRTTTVSTGFTLMHWNTAGNGMGVGKVSELQKVFDVGLQTRFYGGILYNVLESGADLNDIRTPSFYVGENVSSNNYENCPLTSGTFTLEVISMGPNGQVMQRLIQCNKNAYLVYERVYYGNAWEATWHGGWNYPTLSSTFLMYGTSTSDNQVRYRKDGRIVEIRGVVTPASSITGSTTGYTIFTLPTGYRPSSPISIVCQGSGTCSWLLGIKTSGAVEFSRYRDVDGYATANNNTWLPFQATFITG